MNNKLRYRGFCTAELLDAFGKVKQTVKTHNAITDGAFNAMFSRFMFPTQTTNGQSKMFGGQSTMDATNGINRIYNVLDVQIPTSIGVYVMNTVSNITNKTQIPPYVDESHINKNGNVLWYNQDGVTTEDASTIIPVYSNCKFDTADHSHTVQFVKTTGSGTARSFVIGVPWTNSTNMLWGVSTQDTNWSPLSLYKVGLISSSSTETCGNFLEYYADKTVLWSPVNTSTYYSYDLVTKQVQLATPVSIATSSASMGLSCNGGAIVQAQTWAPSGNNVPVTVRIQQNWKTVAQASKSLSVPFTAPQGETVTPLASLYRDTVLVANNDTGYVELFFTTFAGASAGTNAGSGYYVGKAVIDPDAATPAVVSLTYKWMPFAIGGYTASATNMQPLHGFINDDGNYVLPYIAENGLMINTPQNNTPGVTLAPDLNSEAGGRVLFTSPNQSSACSFVRTDKGIQQLPLFSGSSMTNGGGNVWYRCMSRVLCGFDFPEPITKTEDDSVRITYKFGFTLDD